MAWHGMVWHDWLYTLAFGIASQALFPFFFEIKGLSFEWVGEVWAEGIELCVALPLALASSD